MTILLNDVPVVPTIFPDKTMQVWKLPFFEDEGVSRDQVRVVWNYESDAELLQLVQLDDLMYSYGISYILHIPFFPYGRQDKAVTNQNTFGKVSFIKVLRCLTNVERITTYDLHSAEYNYQLQSLGLIILYPEKAVQEAYGQTASTLVCYPDKGAKEKYSVIYPYKYCYGEKVRDQNTGRITSYHFVGDPAGQRILIVDDICDGGATFILLAKELFAKGAEKVSLFVTHGIFSKGLKVLQDAGISEIFTRNGKVS